MKYALKVFFRNFIAWKKLGWAILINALDPLVFLLAFGFGLGKLIGNVDGIPYIQYIAPAMVAIASLYGSFFETTYNAYVRMYYDKLYHAFASTKVNLEDIVLGEILWGAFRGQIYALLVLIVLVGFSIMDIGEVIILFLLTLPISFLFSSFGMFLSAIVPSITFFDYIYFVYISPMMLFSESYFPLKTLPPVFSIISPIVFPLFHGIKLMRTFLIKEQIEIPSFLTLIMLGTIYSLLAIKLMFNRIIR